VSVMKPPVRHRLCRALLSEPCIKHNIPQQSNPQYFSDPGIEPPTYRYWDLLLTTGLSRSWNHLLGYLVAVIPHETKLVYAMQGGAMDAWTSSPVPTLYTPFPNSLSLRHRPAGRLFHTQTPNHRSSQDTVRVA